MNREEIQRKVLSVKEVAEAFRRAMAEAKPISLVCLGSGEMFFIAYKDIPFFGKADEIWGKVNPRYLEYLVKPAVREEVLEGVIKSDIIGLPAGWPATVTFLNHYPSIRADRFCDGYIGRGLHFTGLLYKILADKRVYLVGEQAHFLMPVLEKYRINLAGCSKLDYFRDIPRVKDCLSKADFDMVLLSAGIPTLVLAPWIAETLKRCALDFGSTVGLVRNTMEFIGSPRRDFTLFDPDAKTDFRIAPAEIISLSVADNLKMKERKPVRK